jgi:hypothetical protein
LTHTARRIASVYAIAPLHDLCHEIAVGVQVACPGLGYALACRGEETILNGGEQTVNLIALGLGERCSGISFYTTFAKTCVDVTTKELLGKVERHECILNL